MYDQLLAVYRALATGLRGKTSTTVTASNGAVRVRYHNTDVVKVKRDGDGPYHVILNTGGWHTNTTKKRMNEALAVLMMPYEVYVDGGNWRVRFLPGCEYISFTENMVLLKNA
jgi:hypothetical protein